MGLTIMLLKHLKYRPITVLFNELAAIPSRIASAIQALRLHSTDATMRFGVKFDGSFRQCDSILLAWSLTSSNCLFTM